MNGATMRGFVSILAVLIFQVALIGSVCATPNRHSCCQEMTECVSAISCCTPAPTRNATQPTGLQGQTASLFVVVESSLVPTLDFASRSIAGEPFSVHSPPIFLSKSSLLL